MRLFIIIIAVLIPFVVFAEEHLQTVSVDDIKVIKISARDKRAVIKTSERNLQVIKVGDIIRVASSGLRVTGEQATEGEIAGSGLRVVEITRGRIVMEEMTDRGTETVIIRVENGKQGVERISKVVEPRRTLMNTIHEGHEDTRRKELK